MARASPSSTKVDVAARRARAQGLWGPSLGSPAEAVAWLGAVQAQDPGAARWALGVRTGAPLAEVERALEEGAVVRTHAFRYTWQLIAAADVRWMVELVGAEVLRRAALRYRHLGLDAATQRRARSLLERALRDGAHLTRSELGEALERGGVSAEGQRLPHLLGLLELEGRLCGGRARGKAPTWVWLDAWVKPAPRLTREEALASLAERYFKSRGPASVADFTWWSGLKPVEARAAVASLGPALAREAHGGRELLRLGPAAERGGAHAHLLPGFDEYLIAYSNRDAMLDPRDVRRVNSGGGLLFPCVLLDGKVVGLWRRELRRGEVRVEVAPFGGLARAERARVETAARRYAAFLGEQLRLDFVKQLRREKASE